MRHIDHRDLARVLLPAVIEAGRVQMRYLRKGAAVETKADSSPVTAADRESEAVLIAALGVVAPGVPVVAEESVADGRVPEIGDEFFLVDPLDGTREFVAGRDEFTINVALVRDRQPVFGLVYAPARSHMFLTRSPAEAVEAHLSPDAAVPDIGSIAFAPIATRAADPKAIVALQSRSHASPGEELLDTLQVSERRRLGSSIKFCLIARGEADVYLRLGRTCEWDTAAGHAILSAAGGRVTRRTGEELTYGHSADKFTNPEFLAWGRNPLIVLT